MLIYFNIKKAHEKKYMQTTRLTTSTRMKVNALTDFMEALVRGMNFQRIPTEIKYALDSAYLMKTSTNCVCFV